MKNYVSVAVNFNNKNEFGNGLVSTPDVPEYIQLVDYSVSLSQNHHPCAKMDSSLDSDRTVYTAVSVTEKGNIFLEGWADGEMIFEIQLGETSLENLINGVTNISTSVFEDKENQVSDEWIEVDSPDSNIGKVVSLTAQDGVVSLKVSFKGTERTLEEFDTEETLAGFMRALEIAMELSEEAEVEA